MNKTSFSGFAFDYVEILGCLALAFKHKSESKILRAHVAVNFFFFAQILSLLLRRALRLVPVFLICRVWGLLFYPMVFSVPPCPWFLVMASLPLLPW
jgi:hypothetical protein